MTQVSTSPLTASILRSFANGLRELIGDSLQKILLIGSHARGDYTPDSDIDLVLILKRLDDAVRDRIYEYLVDFELQHDVDISLKVLDRGVYNKWRRLGDPFVQEIEKEGIAL